MTSARAKTRADADYRTDDDAVVHGSAGGPYPHDAQTRAPGAASGGRILGRYVTRESMRCGCCRCRIGRGELVYEVLVAELLLDVCAECVGPAAW